MTKAEFLRLHPNVKGTPAFYPAGFSFEDLHLAICKSRLLKKMQSLNWLCRRYDVIVAGKYDDFEVIDYDSLKTDPKPQGLKERLSKYDYVISASAEEEAEEQRQSMLDVAKKAKELGCSIEEAKKIVQEEYSLKALELFANG